MAEFIDASGNRISYVPSANLAVEPGHNATYDIVTAMPVCDGGSYISTATTTTVESGPCVLHSIVIGETAAGAITVYDNTAGSGTVIAVLKASIVEGTYTFNRQLSTGCTVVTAGASKITVNTRKVAP